ncbi:MAG: hydrogenase expression/formation protein [Sulfuricaulis sp.]|uniref:hydrogenase expression/formation C-terminal domain-containing protein n=1 Tax=Sulfuricaulis sp. TaxID=2003553 RepID=UPI0025EEC8BF|nr:hydrogenase expression/formation C-terminal domain-containing protein [Sulfuricaulis sp.]MCR4347103.1 hydrogenase expression/formation protein [Sulfuricaulis sp.]
MNHIKGIPIATEGMPFVPALSHGNALPLLHEIEVLLSDLVTTGKSASIDLRSLPMLPDDYEKLLEVLGEGEVSATVNVLGPTLARETAIHGVWWVTHQNADGEVTAQFIEVTYLPEILKTHPADARAAVETLRSRLLQSAPMTEGDDHAG